MNQIAMLPVQSSQIEAVGYESATQTLAIQFKGVAVYHYDNVPEKLAQDLLAAELVGSFFYKNIKPFPDRYPYKKQEAKQEQAA